MRRILLMVLVAGIMIAPGGLRLSNATMPDYAQNVKFSDAHATPDAAASNITNYINQEERIQMDPNSGDVRVLRTDQKVMLNDYVTAIIQLKKAPPRELRGPIRTVVRKEGGEADVLQDKVSREYFLQVTCPKFQLPFIEKSLAALDEDWIKEKQNGSGTLYYPMKWRDVEKVLAVTNLYRGPEGFFYTDTTNNALFFCDQIPLMAVQQKGLKEVDIPPNQMMLDVSIYEVSTANNLLLGTDFVSWKNGPGRNLFEGLFSYTKQTVDSNFDTGNQQAVQGPTKSIFGSFSAVLVSSYVDFLRTKGKARLLNRAQVTAKSGTTATISSQDELVTFKRTVAALKTAPVYTVTQQTKDSTGKVISTTEQVTGSSPTPPDSRTATAFKDSSGNPVYYYEDANGDKAVVKNPDGTNFTQSMPGYAAPSLDYAKSGTVGVNVSISPVVGQKSSEVRMTIDVSEATGFTPSGTPIIKSRRVDSAVRLVKGEPYVVAGLTRKSTISSVGKVPILGSIPIIGWLFGHETEGSAESQIVIVVNPDVTLNAESVIAMPENAKTAMAIVSSEDAKPEVPSTSFGFDQWLLDN